MVAGVGAVVPAAVVAVTATDPDPAGVVARRAVGDRNWTAVAGVDPKSTELPGVKFVPLTTTWSPPGGAPDATERPVAVGGPGGASPGHDMVINNPMRGGGTTNGPIVEVDAPDVGSVQPDADADTS